LAYHKKEPLEKNLICGAAAKREIWSQFTVRWVRIKPLSSGRPLSTDREFENRPLLRRRRSFETVTSLYILAVVIREKERKTN
jgi:hypothetical protein